MKSRCHPQTRPARARIAAVAMIATAIVLFGAAAAAAVELRGDDRSRLTLGAGAYYIFPENNSNSSAAFVAEYRFGRKLWYLGPALGVMANTDGAVNPYFGLYSDIALGGIVLSPFAGISYYHKGDSAYLGGPFEFRLSVDAAWEFENASRLGLRFAHLSNASVNDHNPGEEELLLIWSFPLGD
jgi:hypothetical protein